MNVPQLNVIDLVGLQSAIALLLCDEPRLNLVPIVPEIKLHQESDLSVDAIWTVPRSAFTITPSGMTVNQQLNFSGPPAAVGSGILIEMPTGTTTSQNVTGPPTTWEVSVVAFEERNTNLTAVTGIGIMSEQLCQIVKDCLHLQQIFGYGCLKAMRTWFEPAHDWMGMKPGIIANRVKFEGIASNSQTTRSPAVIISFLGGNCALTCSDTNAVLSYTIDGTVPVAANTNAQNYVAPFAVNSGDMIMAASRSQGKILSEIFGAFAP